jgi:hypothetical protein
MHCLLSPGPWHRAAVPGGAICSPNTVPDSPHSPRGAPSNSSKGGLYEKTENKIKKKTPESFYVAQAGLELKILQSHPPDIGITGMCY